MEIFLISETKTPKKSGEAVIKGWYEKMKAKGERAVYTVDFTVDSGFGEPGAIVVANRHLREFFLESIVVEGFPSGAVNFLCNSWVQTTNKLPSKRVFFSNKVSPSALRYKAFRKLVFFSLELFNKLNAWLLDGSLICHRRRRRDSRN